MVYPIPSIVQKPDKIYPKSIAYHNILCFVFFGGRGLM
jgi:hypothetical protein